MCDQAVIGRLALPGGRSRMEDGLLWLPISGNGAPILCFSWTWARMTVDPPRSGRFWIKLSKRRLSVPSRRDEDRSILRIYLPTCRNFERKRAFPVRAQLVSHLSPRIANRTRRSAKAFSLLSSRVPVKVPLPASSGLLPDRCRTILFPSRRDSPKLTAN